MLKSFQLLGIFPVTRKAPQAVILGVPSEVGTPLAWNLRLADIRDKEIGSINFRIETNDRELQEETDGQEAQVEPMYALRNSKV